MTNRCTGGGLSRRDVLSRGVVATGGVAVVGLLAGCSGYSDSGQGGGNGGDSDTGFIPTPAAKKKVESWSSLEVVGALDGTYDEPDDPSVSDKARFLEQAPDCDDGPVVIHQGYRIKRSAGELANRRDIAILFVDPNVTLPTGEALTLSDSKRGCQGILYGGGKGTHEEDMTKVTLATA